MAVQRVLITGTTSGLGRALLAHYLATGAEVVAVNRRHDPASEQSHPLARFEVLDITSDTAVRNLLRELEAKNFSPQVLILNAGINQPDNLAGLDHATFRQVLDTNLHGVMTFVGALRDLQIRNRVIAAISSTSNIVPNPAHLAYHLSKWALWRGFRLLSRNDSSNLYKVVILGPVETGLNTNCPLPPGMQKRLFDFMAVDAPTAAAACADFFQRGGRTLYYPLASVLFYQMVRCALIIFPFLYRGSRSADVKTN